MLLNLERLDMLIAHYVSGTLPEAARVLIGSHLEMQVLASRFAQGLEALAGDALASGASSPLSNRDQQLLDIFASAPPYESPSAFENSSFPYTLATYAGADLPDIPWKTKLPGLRQHVIQRSREVETSLLWARPGRALPHHGHGGLELTLVLEGEFHDHRGNFAEGDVSVADESIDHRPVAGKRQPCLCFSVLFAPIALSGPTLRLLGDIIGI